MLDIVTQLQEKCDLHGVHFTAYLPVFYIGMKNRIRLNVESLSSTAASRASWQCGSQTPSRTIPKLEIRIVPVDSTTILLRTDDKIPTARKNRLLQWLPLSTGCSCTFESASD